MYVEGNTRVVLTLSFLSISESGVVISQQNWPAHMSTLTMKVVILDVSG